MVKLSINNDGSVGGVIVDNYTNFNSTDIIKLVERHTIKRCADIAEQTLLPKGYQYGPEAMINFHFGAVESAEQIRKLLIIGEA